MSSVVGGNKEGFEKQVVAMKKKADATMVETALSTFKALFFFLTLCFVGGVGVIRVKQWRR